MKRISGVAGITDCTVIGKFPGERAAVVEDLDCIILETSQRRLGLTPHEARFLPEALRYAANNLEKPPKIKP